MNNAIVDTLRPLFQEVWDTELSKLPKEVKILRDGDFDVCAFDDDHLVRNGRIVTIIDLYNDVKDKDFYWLISFPKELLPRLTKMAAASEQKQTRSDFEKAVNDALQSGMRDDELHEIIKLAIVKHTHES